MLCAEVRYSNSTATLPCNLNALIIISIDRASNEFPNRGCHSHSAHKNGLTSHLLPRGLPNEARNTRPLQDRIPWLHNALGSTQTGAQNCAWTMALVQQQCYCYGPQNNARRPLPGSRVTLLLWRNSKMAQRASGQENKWFGALC